MAGNNRFHPRKNLKAKVMAAAVGLSAGQLPTSKQESSPSPATKANNLEAQRNALPLILEIYKYRHLLRNLRDLHELRQRDERDKAPRIKGPRVAAVLARLWASEDLGLPMTSQKAIGIDLGIAPSEMGKMLRDLRADKPGPACVRLVSDHFGREHVYEITDEGKRQLSQWLMFHVSPAPYRESASTILRDVDPEALSRFVEHLKSKTKELLSH